MQQRMAKGNLFVGLVAVLAALSSCTPHGDQPQLPEADADFRRGQGLVSKMDYSGAIRSFNKALLTNPNSAPAHLEVAYLYMDHASNPAAAVHHFNRYLEIDPENDQSKVIRQHMDNCKMELAKQFLIAPVIPTVQRELDGLKDEIKRLQTENAELKSEIRRFKDFPPQLEPMPTDEDTGLPPLVPLSPPSPPLQARIETEQSSFIPAALGNPAPRYHEVRNGDYPAKLARVYGLKVNEILSANPGINPRNLKIGTRLRIPEKN